MTDPDDLAWMEARLTGHPWKCFEQPLKLTNEAAFNALPQYHIVCTSTFATRDEDLMARPANAGRLWDIDTGHDLMITEPQAVTDALIKSPAPSDKTFLRVPPVAAMACDVLPVSLQIGRFAAP